MLKVKIIESFNNTAELERKVQKWMDEHPDIYISHMLQSQSGECPHVTITLFYTEDSDDTVEA